MVAILFLVVTVTLSIAITRIGTVALVLTGMSKESAFFQARSAFYGVGFTTGESEMVVNHPVRRRIIVALMVLGNLGIATMVATMIASLMSFNGGHGARNLLLLGAGMGLIWAVSSSRWLNHAMTRLITAALRRWTSLDVRDYVALLHLAKGYAVLEIHVHAGDFWADKTLAELNLSARGMLVLAVQRGEAVFLGAPTGRTRILGGDVLTVYGPPDRLGDLHPRSANRPVPAGLPGLGAKAA